MRRIAALACLLGLAGCGEERGGAATPGATTVAPGEWRFDVAAVHGAVDHGYDTALIEPGRFDARRSLVQGWAVPQGPADGPGDPAGAVDALEAVILLHVAEQGPRELRLRVAGVDAPDGTPQELVLRVRDQELFRGTLASAMTELVVPWPVELQSRRNRVELGFRHLAPDVGLDRRAAFVERLEVRVLDPSLAAFLDAGRRLLPEGSAVVGREVHQLEGTELTYYADWPDGAVLEGRVRVEPAAGAGAPRADVRLSTGMEGGYHGTQDVEAWHATLAPGEERLVRLARWSVVSWISMSVDAVDESDEPAPPAARAPLSVVWSDLVVRAPPPSRAEPRGLHEQLMKSIDVGGPAQALTNAPVIVILLDALNPSILSCYGGRSGLSPNIDRLSAEGLRFTQAFSPASYTIAGIASLLTGRSIAQHDTWTWKEDGNRLPDSVPTLAEAFRAAGYRTAAVVHSPNGSKAFGFDRGFERFVDLWRTHRPYPRAADVYVPLDELLSEGDAGSGHAADARPMFLWLHILEPHEPYHPPAPWAGRLDPDYAGDVTGDPVLMGTIRDRERVPTARDLAHLRTEYEETLAYADSVVGGIRERLERAGLWERAIVALVSDHGEGFLEHQGKQRAGLGHGSTAYVEMTRVPLVIKLPSGVGTPGATIDAAVTSGDLLPALAALARLPSRPLAKRPSPTEDAARAFVLTHSESLHPHRFLPAWSIRDERWTYVHTPGDAAQLFDRRSDPGEQTDVLNSNWLRGRHMRQTLRELAGVDIDVGVPPGGTAAASGLTPEMDEQLRALGYVR